MEFIMLIGLPASGKTSWGENYCKSNPNAVLISSDNIRALLYGDAAIQGDNHKVFDTMFRMVREALTFGHDVIYDATNLSVKERRGILKTVHEYDNVHVRAKVFIAPVEELKERNSNRARKVPEYVYDKMLARFMPPLECEGFAAIEYVFNGESSPLYESCYLPCVGYDQHNPHHSLTLDKHCQKAFQLAKEQGLHPYLQYALLFHDCGKPYCQTFDEDGVAHYYNHNSIGAYRVLSAHDGTEDENMIVYMAQLIAYHMLPYNEPAWENTKRRLPESFINDVELIHRCDEEAH